MREHNVLVRSIGIHLYKLVYEMLTFQVNFKSYQKVPVKFFFILFNEIIPILSVILNYVIMLEIEQCKN